LDWLRGVAGDLPLAKFGTRHVEALTGKKSGPTAANTVKKNLSTLFNFAIKRDLRVTFNPARYADRRKENADDYHTWAEASGRACLFVLPVAQDSTAIDRVIRGQ